MTHDLDEARRIVLEGLAGREAKVYLFGSWAKGTATRASDIDIAVLGPAPLPGWLMSEIAERLEDSSILYRVDLVDLAKAPVAFRTKVQSEGVAWNA
ncbi:MAG: nucleotidyltransferase domain-containing protein [Acidobacteria bacterium]|nr:nucleotidyltransferase domain-containing protein [Acidobacteriota bacterium]